MNIIIFENWINIRRHCFFKMFVFELNEIEKIFMQMKIIINIMQSYCLKLTHYYKNNIYLWI